MPRSDSGRGARAVAQRHGWSEGDRKSPFERFVPKIQLFVTKHSIGGFRKGCSHHPGAGVGPPSRARPSLVNLS
jgi:hypothetical protein